MSSIHSVRQHTVSSNLIQQTHKASKRSLHGQSTEQAQADKSWQTDRLPGSKRTARVDGLPISHCFNGQRMNGNRFTLSNKNTGESINHPRVQKPLSFKDAKSFIAKAKENTLEQNSDVLLRIFSCRHNMGSVLWNNSPCNLSFKKHVMLGDVPHCPV